MIYGKRSEQELKYARASAKATEFHVPRNKMPDFRSDPDDLHFTSIYAISEYIEERIVGRTGISLLEDLRKVASFYDAASSDRKNKTFSDGYWTLAALTYFLIGNYGSAKVSLDKISDTKHYGNHARILVDLMRFLLVPNSPAPQEVAKLCGYLCGDSIPECEISEEAAALLTNGSPEGKFFSEALYVVVSDAIQSSARELLPRYSNTDISLWSEYLSEPSKGKLLWQAQKRIGEMGVFKGEDAFIQLPTGSGKTRSIELVLRSMMLRKSATRSIVVAPLKALCSEISQNLNNLLPDEVDVKESSEVLEIDPWLTESLASHHVLIFTPEKLSFILHHNNTFVEGINLFVFDEAHLIDNASRGPAYELLLAELFKLNPNAQRILISAVVSNAADIAEWALHNKDAIVQDKTIQISEKSIGLIGKNGRRVSYVSNDSALDEQFFLPVDLKPQNLKKLNAREKTRVFPDTEKHANRDLPLYFANRLISNGACAIFIPQARWIWSFFDRINDLLIRECDLSILRECCDSNELTAITKLIELHYGASNHFTAGISSGILPHYGNLQGAIRQTVEYAIEHGQALCVACTSTLSEGVNLPIKYLFITGTSNGLTSIKVRDFQNLIGRTARSGKYSEGSIFVINEPKRRRANQYKELFDHNKIEPCNSAILQLLKDVDSPVRGSFKCIEGERILGYILGNLNSLTLNRDLTNIYMKVFGCEDTKAHQLALEKIKPLEAIEGYIANAISGGLVSKEEIEELCKKTLAFSSQNGEAKKQLLELFEAVRQTIVNEPSIVVECCQRTRCGIRKTKGLLDWTKEEGIAYFKQTGFKDLDELVNVFFKINPAEYRPSSLTELECCRLIEAWIEGRSLASIANKYSRDFGLESGLKILDLERFYSHTVSFGFSHFLSQLGDSFETLGDTSSEDAVTELDTIQKKIKYGVPNLQCALFCENVVNDRLIALAVMDLVPMKSMIADRKSLKKGMQLAKDSIKDYIAELPSYYKMKVSSYLK